MSSRPAAVALLLASACTGEVSPLGLGEPIVVPGGALRSSALPGGATAEGPRVTAIETSGGVWLQGQLDRTVSGRVTEDAWAIGIELAELGSGYWTVPVGALDAAFPGERVYDVRLDVGGGLPSGLHRLRVVALDERGRGGAWAELGICVVDPRVPEGLNACDSAIPPPAAIVVLEWDEDVDLDLVLATPEGVVVDARHPTTAVHEEGRPVPPELLRDPHVGRLDGDSNAECLIDGRNAESVAWAEDPPPGLYLVYANLHEACGHPSVRFAVTSYRREGLEGGGYRLVRGERTTGAVLGLSANGGGGAPLYVTALGY